MKRFRPERMILLTSLIGQGVFVPADDKAKLRLHCLISLAGYARPQDDRYERGLIPFLKKLARENGYEIVATDRVLRHV